MEDAQTATLTTRTHCGRRLTAPASETHQQNTRTHTHTCNGPFYGTTQVSRYQKGKTNLDFSEARDSKWQWHQLGHMQVYTLLQTDNYASTPPLSFLQAGCPSCCQNDSVKALRAIHQQNKCCETWTLLCFSVFFVVIFVHRFCLITLTMCLRYTVHTNISRSSNLRDLSRIAKLNTREFPERPINKTLSA